MRKRKLRRESVNQIGIGNTLGGDTVVGGPTLLATLTLTEILTPTKCHLNHVRHCALRPIYSTVPRLVGKAYVVLYCNLY